MNWTETRSKEQSKNRRKETTESVMPAEKRRKVDWNKYKRVKQVDEKQEKRKEQEDWKKQETEDTKRRRIETEVEAIK